VALSPDRGALPARAAKLIKAHYRRTIEIILEGAPTRFGEKPELVDSHCRCGALRGAYLWGEWKILGK